MMATDQPDDVPLIGDSMSTELSANRTAMSFERTAMSNHRTLLSMLRTSLSLIGFGFTIFKFFTALSQDFIGERFPQEAARNFGLAMVILGVVLLAMGIWDHYHAMMTLRGRKKMLFEMGLVHHYLPTRLASSMTVSLLLLLLGILALANIVFSI